MKIYHWEADRCVYRAQDLETRSTAYQRGEQEAQEGCESNPQGTLIEQAPLAPCSGLLPSSSGEGPTFSPLKSQQTGSEPAASMG